jgi:DNA-binding transcriptional ArsR family regulator
LLIRVEALATGNAQQRSQLTNNFFNGIIGKNDFFGRGLWDRIGNEEGLMSAALEVVRGTAQAASLLEHPLRLKVLEQLGEPDSASGLARKLGLPRQVVNYHVKALEAAGVVEFVAERPRRGMKERLMRATARSYLISPEAMGAVEPDSTRLRDCFSWAYLVAAAARAVRDLGILRQRADRARRRLATFTLETEIRFASAGDRNAFTRELAMNVAELAVKYHNEQAPQGRLFRFVLGAYPAITKTDEEDALDAARK